MASALSVDRDSPVHNKEPSQSSPVQDLLSAVDNGDVDIVKHVLKEATNVVNTTNKHGECALHIAAGYGQLDIVKVLIRNGAKLDSKDKHGDTPLYWASRHGHLHVVEYLCSHGSKLNMQDKAGETALHVAARYGQLEVLSFLCKTGITLDTQDKDGEAAIHCACWHGFQSLVECLVEARCNLDVQNNEGETPLHIAAVRGHYDILCYLCDRGAAIDKQDKNGCPPVRLATRRGRHDIVQYLCKLNCDVNIRDKHKETSLHDACREGQLAIIESLHSANCDLNIANTNGITPLHLAAKYGHTEVVRSLCRAGCNIHAITEHGYTADEVAASAGHDTIASLLFHLRQGNLRDKYMDDLTPGAVYMERVKLLVCGASGVGKTELVESLKCRFFRSLFRRRSASSSDATRATSRRTHGIAIQQAIIPNSKEFSIWDFSGLKDYYLIHEKFMNAKNSIFIVVFSLRDPIKTQIAQVRFWLSVIKAKVTFGISVETKPHVVLVASFADHSQQQAVEMLQEGDGLLSNGDNRINQHDGSKVLNFAIQQFGQYFLFQDKVYRLDCRLSQSTGMRLLRSTLASLRVTTIKAQPLVPRMVQLLMKVLPQWRHDHTYMPVLTWTAVYHKTREFINPLVTGESLKDILTFLHDMGEVVYIREGPLSNVVILDPSWLGSCIFGPAFSPNSPVIPHLKSVTGLVQLKDIKFAYSKWDPLSIARLFEHFELCTAKDQSGSAFEFPFLINAEKVYGLWEKDLSLTIYAGLRIYCQTNSDVFKDGLFPFLQLRLRKIFNQDFDDQELSLWTDGLKCCRGEVEVMVEHIVPNQAIEIRVRGSDGSNQECYALLQQFYTVISDTIREINPGTAAATSILSSRDLKNHVDPFCYSRLSLFEAQRGDGLLIRTDGGGKENILDLICCGCEDTVAAVKSVPYMSLKVISEQVKTDFCLLLDKPHPFGQDWCLFVLALGLADDIQNALTSSSPTDSVLKLYESSSCSANIAGIVDALKAIDRMDAVKVLLEGLPLFTSHASNYEVFINVPGVEITSYFC